MDVRKYLLGPTQIVRGRSSKTSKLQAIVAGGLRAEQVSAAISPRMHCALALYECGFNDWNAGPPGRLVSRPVLASCYSAVGAKALLAQVGTLRKLPHRSPILT